MKISCFDSRVSRMTRHVRFGDLSRERLLAVDEKILDQLLRDRRAALIRERRIFVGLVSPAQRACDAAKIDAVMFEERAVLGRRDRLYEMRRQVVECYRLSPAVALGGDRAENLGLELGFVDLVRFVSRSPIAATDFPSFENLTDSEGNTFLPVDSACHARLDPEHVASTA